MKDKENISQFGRSIAYAVAMGTIFNFIGMALLILKWGGVDYMAYMLDNAQPGLVWFMGGAVVGLCQSYLAKAKS